MGTFLLSGKGVNIQTKHVLCDERAKAVAGIQHVALGYLARAEEAEAALANLQHMAKRIEESVPYASYQLQHDRASKAEAEVARLRAALASALLHIEELRGCDVCRSGDHTSANCISTLTRSASADA